MIMKDSGAKIHLHIKIIQDEANSTWTVKIFENQNKIESGSEDILVNSLNQNPSDKLTAIKQVENILQRYLLKVQIKTHVLSKNSGEVEYKECILKGYIKRTDYQKILNILNQKYFDYCDLRKFPPLGIKEYLFLQSRTYLIFGDLELKLLDKSQRFEMLSRKLCEAFQKLNTLKKISFLIEQCYHIRNRKYYQHGLSPCQNIIDYFQSLKPWCKSPEDAALIEEIEILLKNSSEYSNNYLVSQENTTHFITIINAILKNLQITLEHYTLLENNPGLELSS